MALVITRNTPSEEGSARVIGTATSGDRSFSVYEGLTDALIDELTLRSLDETDIELREQTSDKTRFAEGAYASWLRKERYPYALVDANGKLAALIWYGPEGGEDTIAFRSYPPYRGAGLMGDFSRFVLERFREQRPGRALSLKTNSGNEAGIRLYEKLGFVRNGEENGRLSMQWRG